MNVLVVEPGQEPYEKEINGLPQMQETVGGLIQAIYPYEESVAIVCNEEGLLLNLQFNRSVEGGYGGVFGTFFVCGLGDEDFTSLTAEQMQRYKQKFHHAEILLGVKGNTPITMRVEPMQRKTPDQTNTYRKKPER